MTKNVCISIKNFSTYQHAKAVAALRGEKLSRVIESLLEKYVEKNTVNSTNRVE
ncbi:MAG TPA: hypothetical protein PKW59_09830 [Thermotogota bacterium]|nr:hypothetical protein [Thermotogota bacterium]